jgi:hypothetical protein
MARRSLRRNVASGQMPLRGSFDYSLTPVILSDARVKARASRRTPKVIVVTMLHQGVLPKHSAENALVQQCKGRCTGVLRLYLAPDRREVPLRMT